MPICILLASFIIGLLLNKLVHRRIANHLSLDEESLQYVLIHDHGLDIWAYTGYTLEELSHMDNPAIAELLQNIDVLVDGKFDLEQRDLTLAFRGSRNQRVIDMEKTREAGCIVKKKLD